MLTQELESIYSKWLPEYQKEVLFFKPRQLRSLIKKESKKAEEYYYGKIVDPKTASVNTYIRGWVTGYIRADFTSKTLDKISPTSTVPLSRSISSLNELFPLVTISHLRRKIYAVEFEKRKNVWENFNLPIDQIERRFIAVADERNRSCKQIGFSSYIDFCLDREKIPIPDYELFIKDINKVINYCNRQLPNEEDLPNQFYSRFNLPCYMCKPAKFPFTNLDEILDYVSKKYDVLAKFKHKVTIKIDDLSHSQMTYLRESDSFEIKIQNQNIRHQSIDLIHELGHVISYLDNFKENIIPFEKGTYLKETEANKIELSLLKQISLELYRAQFAEILLLFRRVLFEIELYKKPVQDLSRLYAYIFNKCFQGARQKTNSLYLLDEKIVLSPLSTLPHAVSYFNLIKGLYE